jgi:hypothetical protein
MSTSHESRSAGSLRIGDAERITAATALGDHFAAGRIDQDELDQRLSAAYAARTFADLDPLFADLPGPRPARPAVPALAAPAAAPQAGPYGGPYGGPNRARGGWGAWVVPAVPLPVLVLGLLALVSIVGTLVFFAPFILLPLFWMWCFGVRGRWQHRRRQYPNWR